MVKFLYSLHLLYLTDNRFKNVWRTDNTSAKWVNIDFVKVPQSMWCYSYGVLNGKMCCLKNIYNLTALCKQYQATNKANTFLDYTYISVNNKFIFFFMFTWTVSFLCFDVTLWVFLSMKSLKDGELGAMWRLRCVTYSTFVLLASREIKSGLRGNDCVRGFIKW